MRLIDHHCHGAVNGDLDRAGFEALATESDRPPPPGCSMFDSQLGFAIRRWCAPVLELSADASPEDYLARRRELGSTEVNARLLRAADVDVFLVDSGFGPRLAAPADSPVREIVRLESVADSLSGVTAAGFAEAYGKALELATVDAAGVKSIVAYRYGLDFEAAPPSRRSVTMAAGRWLRGGQGRLDDPVLLRHLIWAGVDRGLPLQFHTGFGDPDLDLARCDPLLLTDFLRATRDRDISVMLLHCYPFHRHAGYLAQAFPHVYVDVGLAVNHVGARAAAVLAESLELTPFHKLLYSSDAYGLAELHHLGAVLFRRAFTEVTGEWWSAGDVTRVAEMVGSGNARRVYRL
ncbi:amidohydrolase family protein [Actinoplanes sp. TBRC 11911]|uniref:amidohydrolase family protein n=1 Tax=Actinoplanes sp. TBRC 11911 TaxID=2729386 RepID=UPI00145CCBAB|nr:amidohydrolase family protein [Actinoplanes sp. TBRC 11911]NMO57349.1 amidohydrolase family protein [Actinoplanes sp. TBRC 11911]